jgi:hypothetical protein
MSGRPDDQTWNEMTTAQRQQWTWDHRHDDETTVPDRHIPPSQRDLTNHRPDCNCMGCFYREDR